MPNPLKIGNFMKILSCRAVTKERFGAAALSLLLLSTSACTSVGPRTGHVLDAAENSSLQGIQIVTLDPLTANHYVVPPEPGFAATLGTGRAVGQFVGVGDVVQVSIWEAPPAVLFPNPSTAVSAYASAAGPDTSRGTSLPDYLVGSSGSISVPFAGVVPVAGRTPEDIERDITARLVKKAHIPQVNVRISRNASANASVVGEVEQSVRMPLTPKGETILDALAAAGGTRQPVNKMTIQLTRDGKVHSMPLESVIRDPKQNIVLASGDVVTAFYQPYSFTALGAAGKNEEVNFEATGLTLAQALGRLGGLQDARADPKGVFIFRWEDPAFIANRTADAGVGPDGRIPVIYRVNMKDPGTYFAMQNFPIRNRDVVYIANSTTAEFQRFVGIIASTVLPLMSVNNAIQGN